MSRLIVSNIETQNIKFDSDTTAFTIGSDGVLSGTGSPAMVKLNETIVSSSVSLVAFDNTIITSTYDNYHVTIQNAVIAANNGDLRARCSINNGSNFVTHECSLSYFQVNGSNSGRYNARTSIMITEDEHSNAAKGINGNFTVFGVNGSTTKDANSNGHCTNYGTDTHQYAYMGYTAIDTTSAINYIKIFSDQNITAGKFTIYGIK